MSKDRRRNEFDDDRDARRAAKHANKKRNRHGFDDKIKDVIASGNYEDIDDILDEDTDRNRR